MQFRIKNHGVLFRDYELSDYMEVKEVNINMEENEAFITAEFRADVDIKANGFLACVLDNMSEDNLLDLKNEVDSKLEEKYG